MHPPLNPQGLIPFDDRLTVDIAVIDAQHRQLVDAINALHVSIREKRDPSAIAQTLAALDRYMNEHFTTEETFMARFNFIGLPTHREEHRLFAARLEEYKKQFAADPTAQGWQLFAFLEDWLVSHVINTDRLYVPCFKRNGLR